MKGYFFLSGLLVRTPVYPGGDYRTRPLNELLQDPHFQTAVRLASPVLSRQLEKAAYDLKKLSAREVVTIRKYFNRMCYRPTPFGAFAAFGAVTWGTTGQVCLQQPRLHISESFARMISQMHSMVSTYRVNPSHYVVSDEYRYLAVSPNETGMAYEYSITALAHLPEINGLSKETGSLTLKEWAERLTPGCNGNQAAAMALVKELLSSYFLTPCLSPRVTGPDFAGLISGRKHTRAIPLTSLQDQPVNEGGKEVYANLSAMGSGQLDESLQKDLAGALNVLDHLLPVTKKAGSLQEFAQAFAKRFPGEAILLMCALDPDTGVGYQEFAQCEDGTTLLHGLDWPTQAQPMSLQWTAAHQLLLKKISDGSKSISLSDEDLVAIPDSNRRNCSSIPVMFRPAGEQLWLESAGGVTAITLTGRFTKFGKEFYDLAKRAAVTEEEANPEVLFADIDYFCDLHVANINRRERLYSYIIPIMTGFDDAQDVIPLSDLMVTVLGEEVFLFSASKGKRVIPRLASAFNYIKSSLSVFRFLCDLQVQGLSPLTQFNISDFFPGLNRYPRVSYKKIILSPATWHFSDKELDGLTPATLSEFRQLFSIPNLISVTHHDHYLVFDLDRKEDSDLFFTHINGSRQVTLKEYLEPGDGPAVCRGWDGQPRVTQYIATLCTNTKTYNGTLPKFEISNAEKWQVPGTDWLYYRIYGHPSTFDRLIIALNEQLAEVLYRQGLISCWFFVRYSDPEHHLRFRVKTDPQNWSRCTVIINSLLSDWLKTGQVRDYHISIYQRETERYGAYFIPAIERLFFLSSRLVATYFSSLTDDSRNVGYEHFAFASLRRMIIASGISPEERLQFLEKRVNAFFKEFSVEHSLKRQLDDRYREIISKIGEMGEYSCLTSDYWQKSDEEITTHFKSATLAASEQFSLLGDLIHMHLNRLFSEQPRKQEFIIYYFAWKFEKTQVARARQMLNNQIPA